MGLTPGQQLEGGQAEVSAAERGRGFSLRPSYVSLAILIVVISAWKYGGLNGLLNPFFFSQPSAIGVEAWRILIEGERRKRKSSAVP